MRTHLALEYLPPGSLRDLLTVDQVRAIQQYVLRRAHDSAKATTR
jgi:hypothetical protein